MFILICIMNKQYIKVESGLKKNRLTFIEEFKDKDKYKIQKL